MGTTEYTPNPWLLGVKENLVELKNYLKERFLWNPLVELRYRLRYRLEIFDGILEDLEGVKWIRYWIYLKIVDGIDNLVSRLLLWLSPLHKALKEGLIIATSVEWNPDDLILP
ncbi:MAG: hypothetical protein JRI33_07160 [Deltaproteobacteria bacterium]|nr:hypothetical protein [Deltaproteobacteria bacterium]